MQYPVSLTDRTSDRPTEWEPLVSPSDRSTIDHPLVIVPVCLSPLIDSLSVFPPTIDRPSVVSPVYLSPPDRLSVRLPRSTVCLLSSPSVCRPWPILCLSSSIDCPSVVFRVVCLSPQTDYLPVSPDRPFVGCLDRLLVTLDRLSVRLPPIDCLSVVFFIYLSFPSVCMSVFPSVCLS